MTKLLSDSEIEKRARAQCGDDLEAYEGYRQYLTFCRDEELDNRQARVDFKATGWRGSTEAYRAAFCVAVTNEFSDDPDQLEDDDFRALYEADSRLQAMGVTGVDHVGTQDFDALNGVRSMSMRMGEVSDSTFDLTSDKRLLVQAYVTSERQEADDIAARWNWCVENCSGPWFVSTFQYETPHGQSSTIWQVAFADEADLARARVAWS